MPLNVAVELCLTFWQFFASLGSISDFTVPDAWSEPMYYANVANLGAPFLRDIFPSLRDFRVFFTVICAIVPLIFIFFGLFFLNPLPILMWYLAGVVAITAIVAALVSAFLQDQLQITVSQDVIRTALILGLVLLVVVIITGLIRFCYVRYHQLKKEEEGIQDTVADVMEAETKDFPIFATLQRIVMIIFFVALGLLFMQILFPVSLAGSSFDNVQFGFGITMLVFGFITFCWMIMGCFRKGREAQWRFFAFMEKTFMRFLLITMSILYIPVGSGVFVLFNCNDQTCGAGQYLLVDGSLMPGTSNSGLCAQCYKPAPGDTICPASIYDPLCLGEAISRLEVDKRVDCEGLLVFNIAAFLIIILYMIGLPVMFQQLISRITGLVMEEFPVKIPKDVDEDDVEAIWALKVVATQNSSKFLYQPFYPHMRYTRLYQLLQKLLVVFTAVFVIRVGVPPVYIALIASAVIHFISLCWLAKKTPFLWKFENGVALLMEVCLLAATGAAIALATGREVPTWVLIVIIVLNGVLPIVAIVISIALEWTSRKNAEEEEIEEQRRALEEEMERRMQEAEDRELAQEVADQEAAAVGGHAPPPPPPPGAVASPRGDNDSPVATFDGSMSREATGFGMASINRKKMTKEERAQFQRQQAIEARKAVEERRRLEALELTSRQADVDLRIDTDVKSRLNMFLMGMGLLCFIALGLCVVGLLAIDTQLPSNWQKSGPPTVDDEFVGYETWANFTEHCCCTYTYGNVNQTAVTAMEQWRCDNGHIKERIRITSIVEGNQRRNVSGVPVRPLCGEQFTSGCFLVSGGYDEGKGAAATGVASRVGLYCSGIVQASSYAIRYLW